MLARFRVATRATGVRRVVHVHLYDVQEQLAREHHRARQSSPGSDDDTAGGVVIQQGFHWPRPDPTPIVVMRLWTEQLTASTIAHEAVHAAASFFFMDCLQGWDSRARTVLLGDHEPLAYAVGDLVSRITHQLARRGYSVEPRLI